MKILAIETSAKSVSAAVVEGGVPLASAYQNMGLTHSRTLMPLVDGMLSAAGLRVRDMDLLAAANGPGSFTGLRIGVSALKGLAWALEKPCCGVSTLAAMARNLAHMEGLIICAMDARRQQVYNALFEVRGGALLRRCPDRAVSVEQLAAELEVRKKPHILVGDGTKLCYNELTKRGLPMEPAPPHLVFQSAWGVALAAAELAGRGGLVTAAGLEPVYHRLSQAERERLARQGKAEKCKGDN